ncbi:hypothetical protein [Mycolicibacterium vaccae]|uniref:Immunity protein 35 domain-containing protein n=1 Tax=Mycolicibacterium vaccae ATCC 25954 TaxID=1194972 RepID=K0UXH5_MYCVA|nr:hypothetical protein [Mycolicibacterium vaccae]ANI37347.1 hypothetical protein MYVA_0058 [Mycolicibacterium vaccae 95051]EJZ11456.1 hypothetical protein MVAC_05417 [Mycolicibacterium vaccae ATCC 25954]MCV7064226.1 hypothetical protein [Mycolicibacterium vaccae]
MVDEPRARELARAEFGPGAVVLGQARELELGWYFPCIAKTSDVWVGAVVDKESGRVLKLMKHVPLSRDPTLYDRGYRWLSYDVVVLSIGDIEETVRTLVAMHSITVDVYYRYEKVWRVGRALTEAEVRDRLAMLPAVFTGSLSYADALELARDAGWFEFTVLEYRERG